METLLCALGKPAPGTDLRHCPNALSVCHTYRLLLYEIQLCCILHFLTLYRVRFRIENLFCKDMQTKWGRFHKTIAIRIRTSKFSFFRFSRRTFAVALIPINGSSTISISVINLKTINPLSEIYLCSSRSLGRLLAGPGRVSMSKTNIEMKILLISFKMLVFDWKRNSFKASAP